jgi:hypothetical protein
MFHVYVLGPECDNNKSNDSKPWKQNIKNPELDSTQKKYSIKRYEILAARWRSQAQGVSPAFLIT